MGRRLNTYVHVDHVAYGPEDEVPDEVAEKITAPGVWADEADEGNAGSLPDRDAPKAVWVEAAVNAGIDRADAEKATKATLIEMLGA